MNTYFKENECIVTITETKAKDEYIKVVDLKYLQNAINGLKLLGKEIDGIFIENVFVDLDTKYYHRFDEELIEKFYKRLSNSECEVSFKNGRLYYAINGIEIIIPDDIHDRYSEYSNPKLTLTIKMK